MYEAFLLRRGIKAFCFGRAIACSFFSVIWYRRAALLLLQSLICLHDELAALFFADIEDQPIYTFIKKSQCFIQSIRYFVQNNPFTAACLSTMVQTLCLIVA